MLDSLGRVMDEGPMRGVIEEMALLLERGSLVTGRWFDVDASGEIDLVDGTLTMGLEAAADVARGNDIGSSPFSDTLWTAWLLEKLLERARWGADSVMPPS